jgi:hypothetical protein
MQRSESDTLRILEVGAGLSWMCRAAKVVNPANRTVAQDITSEAVPECPWVDHYHVGDITEPGALDARAPYDVISLTHVIEHLLDPVDVLKRLRQLIAPAGRIFITAPHRPLGWKRGSDLSVWRDWSYNHVPAHVQYFSCGSMNTAARRAGLELIHWSEDHEEGQAFEAYLQPAPWKDVVRTCGAIALLAPLRWKLHRLLGGLGLHKKKVLSEAHGDARIPAETAVPPPDHSERPRKGRSPHPLVEGAEIIRFAMLSTHGEEVSRIGSGEETVMRVWIECSRPLANPIIGLIVRRTINGKPAIVYDTNTLWQNVRTGEFSTGDVIEACFSQTMDLGPGSYSVTVAIASHDGKEFYDWQEDIGSFEVVESSGMQGIANLRSQIAVTKRPAPGPPQS